MRQSIFKIGIYLLLLIIISSCARGKSAVQENAEKLPKVKDEVLISRLDSLSKIKPRTFYTKVSSKYKDNSMKVSFKTSLRMVADSALNALITFARIPIYNSMVTPDTLTIVDRRNNCYIQEGMSYLKNTFDVDFQHNNIEEVLLGMPVGWDSNEEYYQLKDPFNYIISSHNKRSLRRSTKDLTGDVYIRYYLTNDTRNVRKVVIDSPADTTSIFIDYLTREWIGDYYLPSEADVRIETPRDTILMDMKYSKTSVNDTLILYLNIPDKYERCD